MKSYILIDKLNKNGYSLHVENCDIDFIVNSFFRILIDFSESGYISKNELKKSIKEFEIKLGEDYEK